MPLPLKFPRPVIYLSGGHTKSTDKQELAWIKKTGVTHRCFSYAYTCPGAFYYNKRMHRSLDNSLGAGVHCMMDSGAASWHHFAAKMGGQISKRKKSSKPLPSTDEVIDLYVQYCKKQKSDWDFYFTFDYIKHCPTIRKVTERLQKEGLRPVPVYHGDMDIEWFRRYCEDGHKLIGVGISYIAKSRSTWKGRQFYYDQLFNVAEKYGTYLHGLAVTSLTMMFHYPWLCVDSSTWVKTAAYGKIICLDPTISVMPQVHITRQISSHNPSYNNLPKSLQRRIRQTVEDNGFDFDEVRDNEQMRTAYNASMYTKHLPELKSIVEARAVKWGSLLEEA